MRSVYTFFFSLNQFLDMEQNIAGQTCNKILVPVFKSSASSASCKGKGQQTPKK